MYKERHLVFFFQYWGLVTHINSNIQLYNIVNVYLLDFDIEMQSLQTPL